jgi:LuxR family maltose regulon positive regulatory protein
MPKAAATLLWSPERERYEWQHRGENSSYPLSPEEEPGFLRLVDGTSFAFQGKHGRLTLRKESRRHGEGYWYAYRSQGRRTRKIYIGRTPSLSIARLEDVAEALNAELRASTDERSQVKGETIAELQVVVSGEERDAALQGRLPDAVTTPPSGQHLPVLAPKLQLPRLRASLVTRERLLTRLDTGLEGKLTLLSAPAGFGKTTLVSQWVADQSQRQTHPPVAWLSLDPSVCSKAGRLRRTRWDGRAGKWRSWCSWRGRPVPSSACFRPPPGFEQPSPWLRPKATSASFWTRERR